ncbi:MAG: DUF4388 domain-containing protein [Deinococcus sp.]|nr:DUF4388 domain-containing protein [Deinococcus sp.]
MDGNFSLLGPIDILQLLSKRQHTGVFRVEQGEVFLSGGQPVHASYKGSSGDDAFFQILRLKEGSFEFVSGETTSEKTLDGSLENYLLHALGYLESHAEVGPFDSALLDPGADMAQAKDLPRQASLLMKLLQKPATALELALASGLEAEEVFQHLGQLADRKLVRISPRTPQPVKLKVELREEAGSAALVDARIYSGWRSQYGPFQQVEVRLANQSRRINVEPVARAGVFLYLSAEALLFHNLHVGQEVLVWPAL